jgi:hypothetical protein
MDLEINGVIVNSLGTHLGGLKNESPDDKFDKAVIAGLKMAATVGTSELSDADKRALTELSIKLTH